jgi:hypothetical protein
VASISWRSSGANARGEWRSSTFRSMAASAAAKSISVSVDIVYLARAKPAVIANLKKV